MATKIIPFYLKYDGWQSQHQFKQWMSDRIECPTEFSNLLLIPILKSQFQVNSEESF